MDIRFRQALFVVVAGALCARTRAARAGHQEPAFHPELKASIQAAVSASKALPEDRKVELRKLARYVADKLKAKEPANLLFICTHNSRRSHMAQLWAATAAAYYRIDGVHTYSGGTEATAFNPRAVAAMRRAGFKIDDGEGANPHYKVSFAAGLPPLELFSKTFADKSNPQSSFAAVMTCAQADKSCPVVPGATIRAALHYEDPKASDGTPEESATYDARSRQIASEMFYLFSQVGHGATR